MGRQGSASGPLVFLLSAKAKEKKKGRECAVPREPRRSRRRPSRAARTSAHGARRGDGGTAAASTRSVRARGAAVCGRSMPWPMGEDGTARGRAARACRAWTVDAAASARRTPRLVAAAGEDDGQQGKHRGIGKAIRRVRGLTRSLCTD